MAIACSVFSFAITVKLLISYLLFAWRSSSESLKSAATSAEGSMEVMSNKSRQCNSKGSTSVIRERL